MIYTSIIRHRSILASFIIACVFFAGCKKEPAKEIIADFSFELTGDNIVKFTNESQGDYYSATWDFGNGEVISTQDKKNPIDAYYPLAGDYRVSLKISDYLGESDTTSKVVSILNTDLVLSFTAVVDDNNPNSVQLTNTTEGNYDSFKWVYRSREVENKSLFDAYFPFSGKKEIKLIVKKGDYTFSTSQEIMITQNDPEYLNNLSLTWADEFEGSGIDTESWTFETGATGWGNNELQNYTLGGNHTITDGILILTAKKVNDNKILGSYTSTRLVTKNKQNFTFGKMEIRAKLPSGTGIWPAIWMLGSNIDEVDWPACGEIDIMEYVGYEPNTIHGTIHTPSGYGGEGDGSSKVITTCEEEFHVYGILWTEEKIVFYTDSISNVTHTYAPSVKNSNSWPFNLPHFFILNVAVGGDWGGSRGIDNSIFPQSMEIDYVRVYQEQ